MRLGGWLDASKGAEAWAQQAVEHGYGAVYWPNEVPEEETDRYVEAARSHGLVISEVGIWNNYFVSDPAEKRKNIEYAIDRLKMADRVGARCAVNISGSKHPVFWDGPSKENFSEKTFDEVVEITQQIIDEAKPQHAKYSLEPMPWMVPYDVASQAKLLEKVNRPAFGVHADMCNLVNSVEKVYHTDDLAREFFETFGNLIESVHVKDTIIVDNDLTLNISEALPGRGVFDHRTLLTLCSALDPDLPVMTEHLETPEQYDEAANYLKKVAAELGLRFISGK